MHGYFNKHVKQQVQNCHWNFEPANFQWKGVDSASELAIGVGNSNWCNANLL